MSPAAQRCYAAVDACCQAIAEHGDWKITLAEGERIILIEVLAGEHSIGYLKGKYLRMEEAMRLILEAAQGKEHRVIYRVEDW